MDQVLGAIRTRGPLSAEDLDPPEGGSRRIPGAWYGSVPRAVLEACLGRGQLAVAARRPNMARTYDLAERVVPREHFDRRVSQEDAERELVRLAAKASGVGTVQDLADYYRLSPRVVRPRVRELVESGELSQVNIDGWGEPAYLHREARLPRTHGRRGIAGAV